MHATSAYKRNQTSERQSFVSKPNERSEYVCHRCMKTGHKAERCYAIDKKCSNCDKTGHLAKACSNFERKGSGFANTIRVHVETLSPNEVAIFNAGLIEKAEHCGLVYDVEANDVENAEEMTRHQRFGMFGHLIK